MSGYLLVVYYWRSGKSGLCTAAGTEFGRACSIVLLSVLLGARCRADREEEGRRGVRGGRRGRERRWSAVRSAAS